MDLLHYFNFVKESYRESERESSTHDYYYRLADFFTLHLRFLGDGLISSLTPALDHLAITPVTNPDFSINIWDSKTVDRKKPPSPFWNDLNHKHPYHSYLRSERIHVDCTLSPEMLSVADIKDNIGYYWIADPEHLPWWEKAHPLKLLLHWFLRSKRHQILHCAAVGEKNGGVLLVGQGGVGKSTSALACLNSGLLYIGDDHCIVNADSQPHVFSLYNTAKLKTQNDVEKFPHLKPYVTNPDNLDSEKVVFFINDYDKNKMIRSFPISAILILKIEDQESTVMKKATFQDALKAIYPSTQELFHIVGPEDFQLIYKLTKKIPAFWLEAGKDLSQIPEVVTDLLSSHV